MTDQHAQFPPLHHERPQEPEPRPSPAPRGPTGRKATVIAIVVAVVLLASTAILGVAWRQEVSASDQLRSQIEALEQDQATVEAEASSAPNLWGVARDNYYSGTDLEWDGTSDSLTVDIRRPGATEMSWLAFFMRDIGLQSDAIQQRMAQTRALDGTQEAGNDKVRVTWTYHPDSGLSVVFSVNQ